MATLRLIWLILPAAVIGGLGVIVLLAALVPLWATLQRDSQRLQELQQLRDQVTLMRGQLSRTREKTDAAQASKVKIERLITGNGDLTTFVAMLDREAVASAVQLTLFEPTQAVASGTPPPAAGAPAPPAAPPAAGAPPGAAPAPDPLLTQGLSLRTLLVSARGSFPSLLTFLRRLEALNVLVVQSDLSLSRPDAGPSPPSKANAPEPPVLMKLSLGLYSRLPAPPAKPAAAPVAAGAPAPQAATPPAAAPAPPPAPAPAAPAAPAPAAPN